MLGNEQNFAIKEYGLDSIALWKEHQKERSDINVLVTLEE